ncbi:MAG: PBSX family phage terminase large subunit [Acutalibacteraceae bacterium]|jgi:phage terminase large subunit
MTNQPRPADAPDEKGVYLPAVVGGGYRAFWNCRKRYRVVKGGKASKKSSTAALWYVWQMMKYPDANVMVIRAVQRTHENSTFAQLRWAIRRLGVEHLWDATRHPLELTYRPTGQKIFFRGMDKVEKLASTTVERGVICWVWIEEAYEIADEEDFLKLDLSMPRGVVTPPLFKQTTLTFNPWSDRHWLKRRFFDQPHPDVLAMTTTYRCNEFLDDADRAVYENLKRRSPRRYAVAGLGEWGVAQGLVFDRWRVEAFDKSALPESCRFIFGLDYGYANDPTAFIGAAVDQPGRTLYIFDEHYGKRMLNSDIAAMIRQKGYAKERIRADSAEPKSNEELRRMGLQRICPAIKGPDSVLHGIARLQEYDMVVHPDCVNTVAELSAYCWDKDQAGQPVNRPVDRDNHLMDALRYAMADVPLPRREERRRPSVSTNGVLPAHLRGQWGGA